MSTIKVDTLVAADGSSAVTLTKQSACKAWADIASGLASIHNSFGISSVDDNGTGTGDCNVTNNFDSASHVPTGSCPNASSVELMGYTTGGAAAGSWTFATIGVSSTSNRTFRDRETFTSSHGDLA